MKTYAVLEIVVDIDGRRKWSSQHEIEAESAALAIATLAPHAAKLRPRSEPGDTLMFSADEITEHQNTDAEEARHFFEIQGKLMRGRPLTPEEAAEVQAAGIMNEENIPVEQRERIRLTTDPPDQE